MLGASNIKDYKSLDDGSLLDLVEEPVQVPLPSLCLSEKVPRTLN